MSLTSQPPPASGNHRSGRSQDNDLTGAEQVAPWKEPWCVPVVRRGSPSARNSRTWCRIPVRTPARRGASAVTMLERESLPGHSTKGPTTAGVAKTNTQTTVRGGTLRSALQGSRDAVR